MKKRTKITLRTKIYLTIAGLVTLAGILYASNPAPFSSQVPFPTGVAAAPDLLLVSPYCSDDINQLDRFGQASLFVTLPGFGSCREKYMAIAPNQAAMAGFTPRDVFATQGPLVFKIHNGVVTLFATLPGCFSSDHIGLTFDHFGTYGFDLIVTCQEGNVFRVNGTGTPTHIASVFAPGDNRVIEGPAVVPPAFGPHGGKIWVADEIGHAVHTIGPPPTYTVTQNILFHITAEAVYYVPTTVVFAGTPGSLYLAEQQQFQLVWEYPLSDFQGLVGNIILTSEAGADFADTSIVTTDGTNYFQNSFAPRIPGVNEGAAFVDPDVPTATPTTTPTATFTPTATSTPTATATFTPTPTATFTPTPTATATSTPTPTPTPAEHVSQITPTGTTCNDFKNGTAETLLSVDYAVKNGLINQLAPGVFFYWLKVTVPAGNNVFTITETITTGNFSTPFALANGGNNVFNNNCTSTSNTITQDPNTGTVTVTFNAPAAGDYFISLKYNSNSLKNLAAPSPTTTVHYDFTTTGVPGSTSGIDLIKQ
jgi:hypothetical protein